MATIVKPINLFLAWKDTKEMKEKVLDVGRILAYYIIAKVTLFEIMVVYMDKRNNKSLRV